MERGRMVIIKCTRVPSASKLRLTIVGFTDAPNYSSGLKELVRGRSCSRTA
jgi:hypothetical protein